MRHLREARARAAPLQLRDPADASKEGLRSPARSVAARAFSTASRTPPQNPGDGGAAGTGRRHQIVRRGRSTRLSAFGYRARRNWIWVTSVRCGATPPAPRRVRIGEWPEREPGSLLDRTD